MRTVLEADVVLPRPDRSRASGLAAMFADLSPRIRLVGDVLQVAA